MRGTVESMTHIYEYGGYGAMENCQICDDFTNCDEYNRLDGLVCFICGACVDELHAMNRIRTNAIY